MAAALAAQSQYTLIGRIEPPGQAIVSLHGATAPFSTYTVSDDRGRFQFRRLAPGTYTLAVFIPRLGEARRTVEISPSLAGARGRIEVTVDLNQLKLSPEDDQRDVVSARQLAISDKAHREYEAAEKNLSRREAAAAVEHLQKAVEISPQFAAAWNTLGTIAYQTRQFEKAESYFRQALQQDPDAYAPLVNLGGVLLTLGKLDEAVKYNLYAVLVRPQDALANSQLGMTYYAVGNPDLARKYLVTAKRLDPAHFSHPQLTLAEIDMKQNKQREAAAELEEFLHYHPDAPQAARIRETIARLKQEAGVPRVH